MARLFLPSSMAENFSLRGHEKFQKCQENPSFNKCASLKENKYPIRAQKSDLTRRVSCVFYQNE
jgi:hypothetical protein